MHLQAKVLNAFMAAELSVAATWGRNAVSTIRDLNQASKVSLVLDLEDSGETVHDPKEIALKWAAVAFPLWAKYGTFDNLSKQTKIVGKTLSSHLQAGFEELDKMDLQSIWALLLTGSNIDAEKTFNLPGLGTGTEWIIESSDLAKVLVSSAHAGGSIGPLPKHMVEWVNRVNQRAATDADFLMINLILLRHEEYMLHSADVAMKMAEKAREEQELQQQQQEE